MLMGCLICLSLITGVAFAYDWGDLSDGTIHIILSSHQDIGWENTIPWCTEQRVENIIKPVLGWMEDEWANGPGIPYSFCAEHTLMLMEYLDAYPSDIDRVRTFMGAGKFECGATYNCNYESLLSNEGLVRNVYLGRKWMKDLLGEGCDTRCAWNPDVPARAMQMPQILLKAGVDYMMISRIKLGFIKWKSPDGSSVLVYSNGHYGYPWNYNDNWGMLYPYENYARATPVPNPPDPATAFPPVKGDIHDYWTKQQVVMGVTVGPWQDYYIDHPSLPPDIFPFLYTNDMGYPSPWMIQFLDDWANTRGPSEPEIVMSTSELLLDEVSGHSPTPIFEEWTGERPNPWLYIHGPGHHYAVTAMREAGRLLPAAETFATVDCLVSGDFGSYPTDTLVQGWSDAIYPDVGWGGLHGEDTDDRFLQHAQDGQQAGQEVLASALESIAARVRTSRLHATPINVFNTLPWERTDPVICTIDRNDDDWSIINSAGHAVSHQVLSSSKGSKEIVFIAENVPSLGYSTYYLVDGKISAPDIALPSKPTETSYSNRYYRAELADGGINLLRDVEQGRDILEAKQYGDKTFQGAELFGMYCDQCRTVMGDKIQNLWLMGAGEFIELQQPNEGNCQHWNFYQLHDGGAGWTIAEPGPVRDAYEFEKDLDHCSVREKLIFYRGLKRLDCEVSILGWDGAPWWEWRLAFPVKLDKGFVSYEVPMGVVRVGRDELQHGAGGPYPQDCRMVNPREVQNFISVFGDKENLGITMSSSVAVCGYVFPPTNDVDFDTDYRVMNPVLQPLLLATRHSCHWPFETSNYFSQCGDHNYRFSIFSHEGDWSENGIHGGRLAIQANNPLMAVVGVTQSADAHLLESKSFCSVSPDNMVITALKKRDGNIANPGSDTDDTVILRMYDIEGKDSQATVDFFFTAEEARKTSIIEDYEEEGVTDGDQPAISDSGTSVTMNVGHHSIETIALSPAPTLNHVNLHVSPTSTVLDGAATLSWSFDPAQWDDPNTPVDIYLFAAKDPAVIDGPSSLEALLQAGTLGIFGPNMDSFYIYRGSFGNPTYSNVTISEVGTSGSITVAIPDNTSFIGNCVFSAGVLMHGTSEFLRSDGSPIENSNLFTIGDSHYLNLEVYPNLISPGERLILSWSCDFSVWNYRGVPVDIYLMAIKNPAVVGTPCSLSDALDGGTVYVFEPGMHSTYIYSGNFREPTLSNITFSSATPSGTDTITDHEGEFCRGDYVFAAFMKRSANGNYIRTDGRPIENSNRFTIE